MANAVTSTTPTNPIAALQTRAPAAADADSADRFLTLLVTQMKNQDPLNPLDNAQVTSQLAQINTVKGLEKLNDSFAGVAAQLDAGQALQAAALVGHDVLVNGNRLALGANGAPGAAALSTRADQVVISVKDAAGAVVRRIELGAQPAGIAEFTWDGKNDSGAAMPAGNYTFEATAVANGQTAAAQTMERGRVEGLTRTTNGFMLSLAGLGEVLLSDIQRIH
jgi:flagellar basal-body rod modification protein FlgD